LLSVDSSSMNNKMESKKGLQKGIYEIRLYRRISLLSSAVYFLWWFAVEIFLPHSFNPFLSRFAIVLTFFAIFLLSLYSQRVRENMRKLFEIGLWLLTAHFYYLFYGNGGNVDWVVGSYITVMAVSFGFQSAGALFTYSCYVILLSVGLFLALPVLQHSIFLPGLATVLLQANISMRSRRRAETERVNALALQENIRVRDEFISIASHELKTPLSAVRLQIQLLARDAKKDLLKSYTVEKVNSFLGVFNRQVDRLTELVETMLDVSRISAGQLTLEKEQVDFVKLINEVTKSLLLQYEDAEYKQNFSIDSPPSLHITADPDRLEQVVENILTNAFKYGDRKPISVKVTVSGSKAAFVVSDQGIGIAPEFLPRIFERYERAISSRKISGLGLGLYISKQIVDAHGGTITVESQLKQGSTFTVLLPI
jgi:signal transduction histidine kinase